MLPKNILLVDDESEFLETMARRLRRRSYEVKTALDCAAALAEVQAGWPDAVVLDVMLGDADGIECLCLVKRVAPRLPVIMLTGHASLQSSILGMEQGASNYCLKPIDIEDLIERIIIACKEAGD
ncbi:MAG: response regulator [Sulfuritalea sp.]|nr:response regulator [Sulfuritalea sp.]